MRRVGPDLVFSPTDVTKHLACPHVTTLDLLALAGSGPAPTAPDDSLMLVFGHGVDHERRYLEHLRGQGGRVVEIPSDGSAREATEAALRSGADVVYQGALGQGRWAGYADFLLRVEEPSALGPWRYDVADTKLARRLKVPALIQLATYAEALEQIQAVPARRLLVVAGDGAEHPWRLVDAAAYSARARRRLEGAADATWAEIGEGGAGTTVPVPVPYCLQCRWSTHCTAQWEAADDLSLVAGMRPAYREALQEAGLGTVEALAAHLRDDPPVTLTRRAWTRLHEQAGLQVAERRTGRAEYTLLDPEPGRGLLALPAPSPGDVYLDFEGDPFAEEGRGLEYLAGLLDRAGEFTAWWAHDPAAERRLVHDLLTDLHHRWLADPGLHVYHYAAYEVTRLKELTGRHAVAEDLLDAMLRAEVFVDLYQVVRQALRISKPSYSIKKLEDFYWGQVRGATQDGEVTDALDSVVQYERWLIERDDATLERIRAYNEVDVRSTLALHEWLEQRRDELAESTGPLPRPGEGVEPRDPWEVSDRAAAQVALAESLREAGMPLWAGLVGWHRREDRPAWWDYFRADDMDTTELVADPVMVGGLSAPVEVGREKQSTLWRYTFEPQECRLEHDKAAHAALPGHARMGTVVALDPGFDSGQGYVVVKRATRLAPVLAPGMHPPGPLDAAALQDSVGRAAAAALEAGPSSAEPAGVADALVRRVPPRAVAPQGQETPRQTALRVGRALGGEVLAVQGPPGSGKTWLGAELIRALLDDGLRVGVTALSHAVIANLLAEVRRPALRKGSLPAGVVEREGADGCIEVVGDNAVVEEALASGSARLVGGTAWLWSRPEMAGSVDVLVIDEAGQFSLANAVAVSNAVAPYLGSGANGSSRGLVLLGDPQQLTQPTKAVHPDGSGVSALEHVLDGAETMPPERGVFLDRTWRLHPRIAGFVSTLAYDDRLLAAPGRERQQVDAPGALTGSGLRWVPVRHTGCSTESPDEAEVVTALVADLLAGSWTDHEDDSAPLTEADILVVAPFNAQVGLLRRVLPDGVRAGTVDKFQGQQAPVVLYSLTASSAAEAPRGVGFLYDLNRLNVAVSRAKALTVIVGSPALLEASVSSPEQLRMVNALCRFADEAQLVDLHAGAAQSS